MVIATKEDARAAVQRWFSDIWSKADYAAVDELIDPEFNFVLSFNQTQGIEQFKRLLAVNHNAFEHLTYWAEDDDIVVESEHKAAAYWTMHSDHQRAPWNGAPASNNECSIHGLSLFRFANNKIVQIYVISDLYGLMTQLDGIPGAKKQPLAAPGGRA